MWILDSVFRQGVDLWCRDGTVSCRHYEYDPPFYLYLPDPSRYHEMIDELEDRWRAETCTFRTLFGMRDGFSVHAGRDIAGLIEQQTSFEAQLFNVDVRRDQQFMAEQGIVPCGESVASRFDPDFSHELRSLEIRIPEDPAGSPLCTKAEVIHDLSEVLQGTGRTVARDLFSLVESYDPDIILMSHADAWMPKFRAFAREDGCTLPFSRTGRYRQMSSRSYWSYGRVEHKEAAQIPDGRILIDTDQSFVYREGGLDGVLMASRISGLCPNLASRFTPGTLISSYEIYEALKQGIVVPFRKAEAEEVRTLARLAAADRGGMMFQPSPGLYENVDELDFTSMYPSIIVNFNLSPETLGRDACTGFLPSVLRPVVDLRKQTKRRKAESPRYAGIDAMLKWMLVTCFGYTGYKNAKFGRIEVHEAITARSREILLQTKDLAESLGFTVLHGIVDCLWVQGSPVTLLKEEAERASGLSLEVEHFDWIVFLPLNDGSGAYTRYYGRLADGSVKVRGIAARRHDAPPYISRMQQEMLAVMRAARTSAELDALRDRICALYSGAVRGLPDADVREMVISRRISRTTYAHRCLESAAVQAYRSAGREIAPGMMIRYVVQDARRYRVDPEWAPASFDIPFYRGLLEKAWKDIAYAFVWDESGTTRGWNAQKEIPGSSHASPPQRSWNPCPVVQDPE